MANLAVKLAEITRSFGVKSAYGEPVEIDGVTIVPVALVQYGFGGGGEDTDGEGNADGSDKHNGMGGGGGGGMSIPIGAYVKSGDTARFDPNVIALLAVGIPFVWVAGKALARIIKALKR
jgi:uncharacterized spore protein YtfJ